MQRRIINITTDSEMTDDQFDTFLALVNGHTNQVANDLLGDAEHKVTTRHTITIDYDCLKNKQPALVG